MLIVLNGMSGCGKNTFVDMVQKEMRKYNIVVDHYSTVDWTRNIAKLLGWNGEKDTHSRNFLHSLKTICDDYNDFSFNDLVRHLDSLDALHTPYVCFVDIREPENIARFCKELNAISVYVDRDNEVDGGVGDTGIKDYQYDIVVDNNGTIEDLQLTAETFGLYLAAELE